MICHLNGGRLSKLFLTCFIIGILLSIHTDDVVICSFAGQLIFLLILDGINVRGLTLRLSGSRKSDFWIILILRLSILSCRRLSTWFCVSLSAQVIPSHFRSINFIFSFVQSSNLSFNTLSVCKSGMRSPPGPFLFLQSCEVFLDIVYVMSNKKK